MKKNILIINCHPNPDSLCSFLANEYFESAKDIYNIDKINIYDLQFDPILHFGYSKSQELEQDLIDAQKKIRNCNHLVLFVPMWWGGLPALAKGFFDRIFIRDFSHRFNPKTKRPEKLLTGRTASVIYSQGSPKFYTRFVMKDIFWKTIKKSILEYVGFTKVKRYYIERAKFIPEEKMNKIISEVKNMGKNGF